jgi:hypothetical protein
VSSPFASGDRPGLYDGLGQLLAEVPNDPHAEVTVLGQRCTLRVVSDEEEDTMVVTRWTSADDRGARCEEVLAGRAHERSARQQELEAVARDVEAKMAEMKANVEDAERLGQELTEFIVVQGRHEARIRELDPAYDGKVRFTYHEDRKGQSATLALGQLNSVAFFAQPVVYLRGPLQPVALGAEEEMGVERSTSVAAWQAEGIRGTFEQSFGGEGGGDNAFKKPRGLAVAGDLVYVADTENHRIKVHRLNGTFVRAFGAKGKGDGQFDGPGGLCVADEHLFIADYQNNRIVVTELDARLCTHLAHRVMATVNSTGRVTWQLWATRCLLQTV